MAEPAAGWTTGRGGDSKPSRASAEYTAKATTKAARAAGWSRHHGMRPAASATVGTRPTASPASQAAIPAGLIPARGPGQAPPWRTYSAAMAPTTGAKAAPVRLKTTSRRAAFPVAMSDQARAVPIRSHESPESRGQSVPEAVAEPVRGVTGGGQRRQAEDEQDDTSRGDRRCRLPRPIEN